MNRCHEFKSIDLAWLRRRKMLVPGRQSTLTWSWNGQQSGSICIEVHASRLRLLYRFKDEGGEWKTVDELVPLIETEPALGGRRQWFRCLSCSRRCRILYGGIYFRCRRCHRLKYDTQYEPPYARAASRAQRIRRRLGGTGGLDEPFPDKPKGMHWRTYNELASQDAEHQSRWAMGIMKWAATLRTSN